MPDYTANEIVDILLILGECQQNYRAIFNLKITLKRQNLTFRQGRI